MLSLFFHGRKTRLLEQWARPKRHHAPCSDRNHLTGLGIATWACALLSEHEIAEAMQLHLFSGGQRGANGVEK